MKNPEKHSREVKKTALKYLIFLKTKLCGEIKGRGCADRRKNRVPLVRQN